MEVYHTCKHYLSGMLRKRCWGPLSEDDRAKHYVLKALRYLPDSERETEALSVCMSVLIKDLDQVIVPNFGGGGHKAL